MIGQVYSDKAVVRVDCDVCPEATGQVYEHVHDGRLFFTMTHDCGAGAMVACGEDETPEYYRQAILAQCGTFRMGFPADLGEHKLAVMKVLHGRGIPLGAIKSVLETGFVGTEAELHVLRARLGAAQALVVIERYV